MENYITVFNVCFQPNKKELHWNLYCKWCNTAHVCQFSLEQLEQCGLRTPQCTIQGSLGKPDNKMILKVQISAVLDFRIRIPFSIVCLRNSIVVTRLSCGIARENCDRCSQIMVAEFCCSSCDENTPDNQLYINNNLCLWWDQYYSWRVVCAQVGPVL